MSTTIWVLYAVGEEVRSQDGVGLIAAATTREAAIRVGVQTLRDDDLRMVEEDNAIPNMADCDMSFPQPEAYWQGLAYALSLNEFGGRAEHDAMGEWLHLERTELAA